MRKRSKYKPKRIILDTMSWLMSGFIKMTDTKEANTIIRTRNHMSLNMLRTGKASAVEVGELINAFNMAEALVATVNLGSDYAEEIATAQASLKSLIERWKKTKRFVLTAKELAAIELGMVIHDAQLDASTVNDIEQSINWEQKMIRAGKVVRCD